MVKRLPSFLGWLSGRCYAKFQGEFWNLFDHFFEEAAFFFEPLNLQLLLYNLNETNFGVSFSSTSKTKITPKSTGKHHRILRLSAPTITDEQQRFVLKIVQLEMTYAHKVVLYKNKWSKKHYRTWNMYINNFKWIIHYNIIKQLHNICTIILIQTTNPKN